MRWFKKKKMSFEDRHSSCVMGEASPSLKRLKELTPNLKPFHEVVKPHDDDLAQYSMATVGEQGNIEIYPIYMNGALTMERGHGQPGTVLEPHVHENEIQWLGCYLGLFRITLEPDGSKKSVFEVGRSGAVYICPGVRHSVEFIRESWLWVARIPYSSDLQDIGGVNNVRRLE